MVLVPATLVLFCKEKPNVHCPFIAFTLPHCCGGGSLVTSTVLTSLLQGGRCSLRSLLCTISELVASRLWVLIGCGQPLWGVDRALPEAQALRAFPEQGDWSHGAVPTPSHPPAHPCSLLSPCLSLSEGSVDEAVVAKLGSPSLPLFLLFSDNIPSPIVCT